MLALDFRSGNFKEQVTAWAESLKCAGEGNAARIIEEKLRSRECDDKNPQNCLPHPIDLANSINEHSDVIMILDEFYYGIRSAIDRRRTVTDNRKSSLIVLIATARSDSEYWELNKDEYRRIASDVVAAVEYFEKQMARISEATGSQWLDIDDAFRIICTRLGFGYCDSNNTKPFIPSFKEFVSRVLSGDDFPNAQHLRSLIKAMARMALNACSKNAPVISPAHFTEDVIDDLLPGDPKLIQHYKTSYERIIDSISKRGTKGDLDLCCECGLYRLYGR